MNLEALKKEYATQDNRCTAYPIYVTVQKLTMIGVIADGYSCNVGEEKTEYYHDSFEGISYHTLSEAEDAIRDEFEDKYEQSAEIKNIQKLNCGYMWLDVEMFLTIKGAEEYMKANSHNLGKCRTYVKWFETRNYEMRGLLKDIGFKVSDNG